MTPCEFPLWLIRLRTQHSVHEDAQIWHCYGCGVGQQLQLWFDP